MTMHSLAATVMRWRRRLAGRAWLFVFTSLAAPAVQAADFRPLDMGVFPYLSTRALLDLYQPVRAYLAQEMGRPVNLFTAPNYKAYTDETQRGVYDIVVTPPHFARLAQRGAGYIPLAMYTRELRGMVVVARDSPIQGLPALKGKRIATPNQLALVTIMGRQLLRDSGLDAEGSASIRDVASHNNAVLAVQNGEVEAAIISSTALAQMPAELQNGVRVIAQTVPVPHVMYLAHPRLGQSIKHIKAALLKFPETAAGRAFLHDAGFEGMRPIDEADLKSMDPYLKELKRLLETTQP
ncbi:MAG: phosphate/phosphite/phosphonate ABC transporter substrate-binding protein [Hydrogenophilales bacterium]|nr:phosphate/phosphite/phosphonate ABC transporter substrate-binding protein [Hydrogenophilales bacterium]